MSAECWSGLKHYLFQILPRSELLSVFDDVFVQYTVSDYKVKLIAGYLVRVPSQLLGFLAIFIP